jgi:single-strand DNA-binding protein
MSPKYTDKDGVEKYSTEIVADSMQMLGSRQGMGGGSAPMDEGGNGGGAPRVPAQTAARAPARQASNINIEDDDIPF